MSSLGRSFRLMGQSWKVLMQDKELMILPLLSGVCILAICASFMIPMGLTDIDQLESTEQTTLWLPAFLFYVVTYTISFFFQAAVIAGASERMAGGDPTVGSSLRAAGRRFVPLLIWGIIAATVGMIIRTIQDRSEVAGRIILGLIGVAWSLATYFMVPVLVMEEQSIGASFKKSWSIFKKTWGETFVGSIGLSLAAFIISIPIVLLGVMFIMGQMWVLGILVIVVGFIALSAVMSALQGIYTAALYRYATVGAEGVTGFDASTLEAAFKPKKKG